jgi:hypothetical protein
MCGCEQRKEWLNDLAPSLGLGNRVAVVAEPVKESWEQMNKGVVFIVGVAVGFWAVPWALRFYAERLV